jgi:proteic killer suppression protein
MEITFGDGKLRKLCEQRSLAQKKLGADCARKLQGRLADLQSASRLGEINTGRPHPLHGDRNGKFAIDLHGGSRLVLIPRDEPIPRTGDGAIDWHHVTRVCIIDIGDYHD